MFGWLRKSRRPLKEGDYVQLNNQLLVITSVACKESLFQQGRFWATNSSFLRSDRRDWPTPLYLIWQAKDKLGAVMAPEGTEVRLLTDTEAEQALFEDTILDLQ